MSQGLFGGYPGCNTASIQFRNGNTAESPYDLATTRGEREERIGLGVTDIGKDDILYIRYDGGGGYGDPLDRDPELVLKDLLWGLITEGPARDIYGVVIDLANKRVDYEATYERRGALRTERFGGRKPRCESRSRGEIARTRFRLGEYLQVAGSGDEAFVQCTWCGERICPSRANWKDYAVVRRSSQAKAGPLRVDSNKFFLLEFFCPGCATALEVEITYQDDPPLQDQIYRWPD